MTAWGICILNALAVLVNYWQGHAIPPPHRQVKHMRHFIHGRIESVFWIKAPTSKAGSAWEKGWHATRLDLTSFDLTWNKKVYYICVTCILKAVYVSADSDKAIDIDGRARVILFLLHMLLCGCGRGGDGDDDNGFQVEWRNGGIHAFISMYACNVVMNNMTVTLTVCSRWVKVVNMRFIGDK